jgi:hypothetical protein
MSQATQKEYCPSCSQRSIGLQPGHICWRCRLSAMILPDIQTIHVVVGANGLYTHQHKISFWLLPTFKGEWNKAKRTRLGR